MLSRKKRFFLPHHDAMMCSIRYLSNAIWRLYYALLSKHILYFLGEFWIRLRLIGKCTPLQIQQFAVLSYSPETVTSESLAFPQVKFPDYNQKFGEEKVSLVRTGMKGLNILKPTGILIMILEKLCSKIIAILFKFHKKPLKTSLANRWKCQLAKG